VLGVFGVGVCAFTAKELTALKISSNKIFKLEDLINIHFPFLLIVK